jgi:predicted DNA-binding WGR domain protein
MSKRRFEFVGGNSYKFWEVEVTGNDVTVCYGRIGTDGQRQTNSLNDGVSAARHAEKLIATKLKKGYREAAVV